MVAAVGRNQLAALGLVRVLPIVKPLFQGLRDGFALADFVLLEIGCGRRQPSLCCVMCKNIGKDIGASFRNMVGGEMQAYTQMMAEAKDKAISYMINQAMSMGADAIVNVRFASTTIVAGGAEILVSGTAVKFTA